MLIHDTIYLSLTHIGSLRRRKINGVYYTDYFEEERADILFFVVVVLILKVIRTLSLAEINPRSNRPNIQQRRE